ncbi:virulence factor Mce family protein [Aeromicrobium marinum DSM 15272]|uniref:Virulence factor Mce family protein n=1 Tax=Aeromicrobium marinum DSM 15272 TaxID=585531 RepID=E2S875_9ACTN|nr:MCE family protein [Aeromicrobium marinum]EFQ84380.1 virulence factor Mce family protein [Aeromicrobium marinum DSM 15272]
MRMPTSLVAVVAIMLTGGCLAHPNEMALPGQVALGDDGYTVNASFASVDNLVPNSAVQRDDVVIGTVTAIEVEGWDAVVTMRLLDDVKLPENVSFTVGQKTLLGAQFVDVVDPTEPVGTLADGATVDQEVTGLYPATEDILAAVSLLLNNGGLSQLSTITTELNTTLADRVPQARDAVTRLNDLTTTLDNRRGEIVATLESLNSLAGQVAEQRDTVTAAIGSISPGLQALENQRTDLVSAATALGQFSSVTNQLINTSQEALLANLGALEPLLADLQASGNALPRSLDLLLTVPFPVSTTQNALKGDYANLFITLDASIPALASAFFGPTLNPPSDINPASASPDAEVAQALDGLLQRLTTPGAPAPPQSAAPEPSPSTTSPPTQAPCNLLSQLLGMC